MTGGEHRGNVLNKVNLSILLVVLLILFSVDPASNVRGRIEAESASAPAGTLPPAAQSAMAFPGAEGFGAASKGGRGGQVLFVTHLEDSGPGSLRSAIDAEGPRIVVFQVGGIIELKTPLEIENPYITLAGQSAPGGGITLKNHPDNLSASLRVETHDVVIRYLRIRPGPSAQPSDTVDALTIGHPDRDVYNVIVDHSSFSWGVDETVQIWYNTRDVTIQWSIISEGLDCSNHPKGCHSKGMLIGSDGAGRISIHHNLFAHNRDRNPMIKTNADTIDIVNNVVYNMEYGLEVYDELGEPPVNIVGNYFKIRGDAALERHEIKARLSAEDGSTPGIRMFAKGNIGPHRPSDAQDEYLIVAPDSRQFLVSERHQAPLVTTTSATVAFHQVLHGAGAILPFRDLVDSRIVNDVVHGTGKWIDEVADVEGWPTMAEGVPVLDSDDDGMPDLWEERYGLDPANPNDGPHDANGDGYTNIEEYLNGRAPVEPGSQPSPSVPQLYIPIIQS